MSVTAEFTIAEDGFALGSMLEGCDQDVEVERVLPASLGVPYLWASGDDPLSVEELVCESPLIESITVVDQVDESVLYRVEWAAETGSLLQQIAAADARLLEAYRDGGEWFFRLRFDSHDNLSAFNAHCQEHDVNYRLVRVYSDAARDGPTAFGLSTEERDTLVLAVERGYFSVPRGVTLSEIGAEFGITQQAASKRVRRASEKVLRNVLVAPDPVE